uniref:DUF1308 domain-containing protein n=1 Tax=Ciona savignyi TaxID=51511 RepID=H2ZJG9_CIOSA
VMDLECLLQRKSESENLLDRVNNLTRCVSKFEGLLKLRNRIKAEIRFLDKLKEGKIAFKQSHLISTNLTSLKALIEAVECIGVAHISALLFNVNYTVNVGSEEIQQSICVDVVANDGHVWVKVIARNAAALHLGWLGQGQFGDRSLLDVAHQFVQAAEQNEIDFQPPKIVFCFANGVPEQLARCLDKLGILISGNIISGFEEIDDSEEENDEEQHPPLKTIILADFVKDFRLKNTIGNFEQLSVNSHLPTIANLDVTTLLSLVSNLCSGSHNYLYGIPVLDEQARQERQDPVLPKLNRFLSGKKLIACETAIKSFQTIVCTIGGVKEKERTETLLKKIEVVPDIMSERTISLKSSGKINQRSKIIFGSGDYHKATTVTANTGYVRAALQNGVQYSTFIHEARALTENKEKGAKLL